MTQRKYTNRRYLDALEKKVLVFDGAMGTSLQVQNLTAEHFGGESAITIHVKSLRAVRGGQGEEERSTTITEMIE